MKLKVKWIDIFIEQTCKLGNWIFVLSKHCFVINIPKSFINEFNIKNVKALNF